MRPAAERLGLPCLPAPIRELVAQRWDAIVVGTGYNGPACATHLAGLLHPLVIRELDLPARGFDWTPNGRNAAMAILAGK